MGTRCTLFSGPLGISASLGGYKSMLLIDQLLWDGHAFAVSQTVDPWLSDAKNLYASHQYGLAGPAHRVSQEVHISC